MKKVEPNTTKYEVENSKVNGGSTFVLEDGKKGKLDGVSISRVLCELSGSTAFHWNKSAQTTPKPTPPVPHPNLPVETYDQVAETNHSTYTQIDESTDTPTDKYSKEAEIAKLNDDNDARPSETNKNLPQNRLLSFQARIYWLKLMTQ